MNTSNVVCVNTDKKLSQNAQQFVTQKQLTLKPIINAQGCVRRRSYNTSTLLKQTFGSRKLEFKYIGS